MNELNIRRTFEIFKPDNDLVEVRIIGTQGKSFSGYFRDVDTCINELKRYDSYNIYFVLNKISDACYSREQQNRIIEKPKNTTSDNDIVKREWILIDIDSKRSTGVSATNQEKDESKQVGNKVYAFLRDMGFWEPVICDSGNGVHLLYKIDCAANPETKEMIKTFLLVLDMYFSTQTAEIDKTVFNESRITKLYGTVSRKGKSTDDRPHRLSGFVRVPHTVKVTPIELIKKVCQLFPQQEKPTYQNKYNKEPFSLDNFIHKHGISIKERSTFGTGVKYILNECLFNSEHKGKDAALFQMSNGAIGYKCLHNSCSQYKWQDVRKMFEPDAYNTKYEEQIRTTKKVEFKPQKEDNIKGDKFLSLKDIKNRDRAQIVTIQSGFTRFDKHIIGFNKGEISLWSGKNGSAKSTIINQVAINAINKGFKGLIFSGELPDYKIKNWLFLQCAGRQYATQSQYYDNSYWVKPDVSQKIENWIDGKLWVYNNKYGNNFEQLMIDIIDFVQKYGIDFIILDNLMAIDLLTLEGDKFEKQTRFINRLCQVARDENIHLHIVAHPRKNTGFLRKDDISGTADLTNAVDNVFICHRNNNDYKKAIMDFYGKELFNTLTECDNYIEICKNRDLGVIDQMVGLFFEIESKRMLNEKYENLVLGWQDNPVQLELKPNNDFYANQPNLPEDRKDDPFGNNITSEEVPF